MKLRLPHLSLQVEATEAAAFVRVGQRVLGEQAVQLVRRQVGWLVGDSARRELHLDLTRVEVPTAGGLGRLVAWHHDLRAAGAELVLRNVGGQALEVFQVTGLTDLLDVRPKDGQAA